ncbi:MAG TPA: hypothetical protein VGE52_17775 [Pirellulales bacterium]
MARSNFSCPPIVTWAAVAAAGWVCLGGLPINSANSQPPGPNVSLRAPAEGLVVHSIALPDGKQQLSIVDSSRRVVAVYHVDPATGKSTLKSVRNINWDLDMFAFNTDDPQPQEIRSMLPAH